MKSRQRNVTKAMDAVEELCWEWVRWCVTRKFYMRPPGQSILARLQPSKSGKEPNGRNDADLQYFNMAVHTLGDMPKHQDAFAAFMVYYMGEGEVVKRAADKLGVSRSTFYERVKKFAVAAQSMSVSIKRVHEKHFGAADGIAAPQSISHVK